MSGAERAYRIGEDLDPWDGGFVFGSAWGYTPPGWSVLVCAGCGADLETWDPAAGGPLLASDRCRACAAGGR